MVLLCSLGRVWFPPLLSWCIFQKLRSKHCVPTHQKDYLELQGLTALVKSKVTLGTTIKNWAANYINQAERRELHLKDNTVSFSITNSSTRPAGEMQKHWDTEAHTSGDMNWTCSLSVSVSVSPSDPKHRFLPMCRYVFTHKTLKTNYPTTESNYPITASETDRTNAEQVSQDAGNPPLLDYICTQTTHECSRCECFGK